MASLTNRRDITQMREQPSGPPPPPAHHHHPRGDEQLREQQHIRHLLEETVRQERADLAQLCVTNRDVAEAVQPNFPVNGAKRFIVRRTGNGGTLTLTAATPQVLLHSNEARLGGTISNMGTNPVTLYLCLLGQVQESETAGFPQIGLAAGQSWDFRLGTILWCGEIVALSTAGTTLTVAEL